MTERVAIVGVAQTRFAPKRSDVNYGEMAYEPLTGSQGHGAGPARGHRQRHQLFHDIWDGQTISDIGITDVIGDTAAEKRWPWTDRRPFSTGPSEFSPGNIPAR